MATFQTGTRPDSTERTGRLGYPIPSKRSKTWIARLNTTCGAGLADQADMTKTMPQQSMDDIVALCKRRGFIYPASEIYGGLNGFWDFGPLGTALKNNLRDDWWRNLVDCPPIGPDGHPIQIVGLDTAIIQNPQVWVSSGHVGGFNDPMIDCRECNARARADQIYVLGWRKADGFDGIWEDVSRLQKEGDPLVEELTEAWKKAKTDDDRYALLQEINPLIQANLATLEPVFQRSVIAGSSDEARRAESLSQRERKHLEKQHGDVALYSILPLAQIPSDWPAPPCPACGATGSLTEPRMFNLMFHTYYGAVFDEEHKTYLRPETAQGIFLNYKNVLDTMRVKVPFGIAQIGKAFRNEVTPRNFIFRSREFEQMEMEWFCRADEASTWFEFWKQQRMAWWHSLGIDTGNLIYRDHGLDELAHYSKACVDIEYRYPFTAPGFSELEGIAHRGCYDLTQHQQHAKVKLEYFDQERNERYVPNVIEPAAGLTRGVLVLICEAYTPDASRPSKVFMKFHPRLAPIKAGIFPLVNKDGMPEVAEKLYLDLRRQFACQLDVKQSIGKRYARMDEAGTPFCFTVDGETLQDQTVTVRDRDTQQQERVAIDQVCPFLQHAIK